MTRRMTSMAEASHIFVLCGFAIAQPLFDLLSRNAGFFVARHSEPVDIIVLVLFLSVVIPALCVGFLEVGRHLGQHFHLALRGLVMVTLAGLTALPALKHVDGLSGWTIAGVAVGIGLAVAVADLRWPPARTFLTFLSPSILIFPALFLFCSPVAKLLRPRPAEEPALLEVNATAPVVMVVFDELPVTSLMDQNGQIDAAQFPNLAAFARGATWFRNATSVSDNTFGALPALLSGRFPPPAASADYALKSLPTASDHPRTLFTLLGGSHSMRVFESTTALCPPALCSATMRRSGLAERLGALASDLGVVYLHVLAPPPFSADLPTIDQTWSNFRDRQTPLEKVGSSIRTRLDVFPRFLDSLSPQNDRPSFYFLHTLLPHAPWIYLPSGRRYGPLNDGIAGVSKGVWTEDRGLVALGYQRHLLQVGFVDRLVGDLIARLRTLDLYDRSLVILLADHGVSFRPSDRQRALSATNFMDVISVPLLVKAPGQVIGRADDRNVQLVDVLPTIADILGIEIPWPVDGLSAWKASSQRNSDKIVVPGRSGPWHHFGMEVTHQAILEAVKRKIALFGAAGLPGGRHGIGPHAELVGQSVKELQVPIAEGSVVDLAYRDVLDNVNPDTGFVPAQIAGGILAREPSTHPLDLAIAINGSIAATTRTTPNALFPSRTQFKGQNVFTAMVPEESLRNGRNVVNVFLVSVVDGKPRLTRRFRQHSRSY